MRFQSTALDAEHHQTYASEDVEPFDDLIEQIDFTSEVHHMRGKLLG